MVDGTRSEERSHGVDRPAATHQSGNDEDDNVDADFEYFTSREDGEPEPQTKNAAKISEQLRQLSKEHHKLSK